MEQELNAALIASTRRVFRALQLTDIDVSAQEAIVMIGAGAELTAEVDVWGDIEGSVTVRMDSATARRLASLMSGVAPLVVDARALDVAGEMASMITEGALGLIGGVDAVASSPTIRLHASDASDVCDGPAISRMRCECECGRFVVESRLRGSRARAKAPRHAAPTHLTGSY